MSKYDDVERHSRHVAIATDGMDHAEETHEDRLSVVNARSVDVFDRHGHHVATYKVTLDHPDCVAEEFEEVALILAERDGHVAAAEIVHLQAHCAG